MPQVLKDEVQERIERAALRVFAKHGFGAASMASIAREAGVATGNLYRYFEDKQALFEAVIPPELPARLSSLLKKRVQALRGTSHVDEFPQGSPFHAVSEELLAFSLGHRLALVFLLGRAEGSPYTELPAQLIRMLEKLALAHFREREPKRDIDATTRFVLNLAYKNLIRSMVEILESHEDEAAIRAAVDAYAGYHLAGLARLFA